MYKLNESFDDNMLKLWKPLNTIYDGENELSHNHVEQIPNKKLDGFFDHWFKGDGWESENEMCGVTCKYCQEFWDKNFGNDNKQ